MDTSEGNHSFRKALSTHLPKKPGIHEESTASGFGWAKVSQAKESFVSSDPVWFSMGIVDTFLTLNSISLENIFSDFFNASQLPFPVQTNTPKIWCDNVMPDWMNRLFTWENEEHNKAFFDWACTLTFLLNDKNLPEGNRLWRLCWQAITWNDGKRTWKIAGAGVNSARKLIRYTPKLSSYTAESTAVKIARLLDLEKQLISGTFTADSLGIGAFDNVEDSIRFLQSLAQHDKDPLVKQQEFQKKILPSIGQSAWRWILERFKGPSH